MSSSNSYPKMGHAPDYSWVAGRVTFTKIQGGCVYVRTVEQPTPAAVDAPGQVAPGTVMVGTAVHHDTSPPLRDMTPGPVERSTPSLDSGMFVPGGKGWNLSKVKDGDYVVLFGHVAGANDPIEMCPGGAPYIADSVQMNP
ncbi:MAG: hypothetical protein M3014_02150 [Chloroflexota bacterium]|nr:hypothetical protein [Chloroflexota bacterium]